MPQVSYVTNSAARYFADPCEQVLTPNPTVVDPSQEATEEVQGYLTADYDDALENKTITQIDITYWVSNTTSPIQIAAQVGFESELAEDTFLNEFFPLPKWVDTPTTGVHQSVEFLQTITATQTISGWSFAGFSPLIECRLRYTGAFILLPSINSDIYPTPPVLALKLQAAEIEKIHNIGTHVVVALGGGDPSVYAPTLTFTYEDDIIETNTGLLVGAGTGTGIG